MNKARRMLIAGLGAMTPVFIATDQVQARTAEGAANEPIQTGAPTIALDQEALKSALLELPPAEKLRFAGDRIRLAGGKAESAPSSAHSALLDAQPARRKELRRSWCLMVRRGRQMRGQC